MKRFIIRFSCLVVLIVAILILLTCLFPPAPSYLSEYKHKMTLLDSIESPRLIFVGGSNLAFGLNSKAIQDSMGMNVVNIGLHAGIGLKSMLDTTEPYLRNGDCVIIAPEYPQFYGLFDGGENLANVSFRVGWPVVKHFNLSQLFNTLEFLPRIIIKNASVNLMHKDRALSQLYSPNGFNKYGDFINHYSAPRQSVNIEVIKKTLIQRLLIMLREK